jgi:hypothetical protein
VTETSRCLDENSIVALFESRLSPEERGRAEEHLASCAKCRRLLAEYASTAPVPNVTVPLADAVEEPRSGAASEDDQDLALLARKIAHAQAAKRVGTLLSSRWTLERLIGIGGMAQVFQATHRNGRAVAVKVMRPELAVEPTFVERFLREGYVANKVDHPGAVAILDDDLTPDGAPFLVMELLRGRTLAARLHEAGCLPVDDALRVVGSVLEVLAAAHDKGIVHRDIKPENLFETEGFEVKVLDFGIARLRDGLARHGHTQSGLMMGTLGYMSPEQARGQGDAVDARSDLWAVGATLYTLATGATLHEAASPNEALLLAMTSRVAPMATLAPGLPGPVADLLDRALAFDKLARFTDARAMLEAVSAARQSSAVWKASRPRSVPPVGTGTLVLPPQTGSLRGVSAPAERPGEGGAAPARPATESRRPMRALYVAAGIGAALAIAGAVRVAAPTHPVSSPPALEPARPTASMVNTDPWVAVPERDATPVAPEDAGAAPPASVASSQKPPRAHPVPRRERPAVDLDAGALDPLGPRR